MSLPTCLCLVAVFSLAGGLPAWYNCEREKILALEARMRTGGDLKLNAKEQCVSDVMTAEKARVIWANRVKDTPFPPAINFFQAKKLIEQSTVYKIIRDMPKGGLLHVHNGATANLHWVISNVTYRQYLYRCLHKDGDLRLDFLHPPPPDTAECQWESMAAARAAVGNNTAFDEQLYRNLSIVVEDPGSAYPTLNSVWRKFNKYFKAIDFLAYEPVMRDYLARLLEEFYEDNVSYCELRFHVTGHDLRGKWQPKEWMVETVMDIVREFKATHPEFMGVKLIFTAARFVSRRQLHDHVKECVRVRRKYPDVFLGLDIVGQEDAGKTQHHYARPLLSPAKKGDPLPYFFHAGETHMQGNIDLNLLDAILMNVSRLGHAFALHKHPELLRLAEQRQIAIELQPISNQVLGLVADLRNHPAAGLLARNHPVVVSSDDPGVWDAKPLSHDFYVTFMAMTSEDDDLRVLKKLAMNSFLYSAMSQSEKVRALSEWGALWDRFIDKAHAQYCGNQ